MSDFVTSNPYQPGTPEYDEYLRGASHGVALGTNRLPTGLLSSLLPNPDAASVSHYIPLTGAISGLVGAVGAANDFATNLLNRSGIESEPLETRNPNDPTNIYNIADKVSAATKTEAERIIPQVSANTPGEKAIGNVFEAAGSMGLPIPGAIASKLPAAVSFMLPGLHGITAPLIAGGITAALPPTDKPPDTPQPTTDGQLPTSPDTDALPVPPIPPATPPDPITRVNATAPLVAPPPVAPPEPPLSFDKTPAPTFQNEGETGFTAGGILATVAGGIALVAGAKYARSLGGGIANAAREARFLELSKEFNAQQVARQAGDFDATSAPKMEAPLPGPSGGVLKSAQTYAQNKNAQLQSWLDVAAKTPDVAKELKAATGNINNEMAWDRKITQQIKTGVDPHTGESMPSMYQWSKDVAGLTDNQQELLNYALYARDEMDTRAVNFRKAMQQGASIDDPQFRHNFYNMDSAKLRALDSAASYDPQVKEIMDRYYTMSQRNIEIGEKRGFVTADDKKQILKDRPNYIPTTDENGVIDHTFGLRSIEPFEGVEQLPTYAWEAIKQHYEGYYRQMELNDWRRAIVNTGVNFQARNPDAARMFTEKQSQVTGKSAPGPNENVLPVRTDSGIKYYYVDNSDIYNLLKNNTSQARTGFDGLGYVRQLYQQGTTGIGALLNGRWFAPVNMGRTALQMSIDRPQGMYGGLIDKVMQQATGGKLAYRGPDPTNFIGAPLSAVADISNNFAFSLSSILHSSADNAANRMLRSVLSDQAVDALSARLMARYQASPTAEMAAQGIGGQGSGAAAELPRFQMGASKMNYSPLNNMVPELYRVYGPMGWATPTYVHLRNFVNEISASVSDAGHSYFWRLNADNPTVSKNVLAHETRQLTGDPGTSGSGKAARIVGSLLPYSNITLQDNARLGRVASESPIAGTLSVAATLTTAALGSLFSAMIFGPAAVNHLENELSTQQREAGVTVYTNEDPTKNMTFSLPQRLRGMYAVVLDMTAAAIGAFDAHKSEDAYNFVMGGLRDFFSHHITTSSMESAGHGFSEMVDPLFGAPTWANAFANLTGNNIRPQADEMLHAVQEGRSVTQTMVHPFASPSRIPNQQGLDTLTDGQDGKVFGQILSSLFGIAGGAYGIAEHGINAFKMTGDPLYAASLAGGEWWQHFKDTAPFANTMLWSNPAKLSVRNPLEENVTRSLEAIKPTLTAKSNAVNEGLTGARGLPTPVLNDPTVPKDPLMNQMYMTTSQVGGFIERRLMPEITAIKKQMANMDHAPLMPDTKRDMANQYVRQLNSKYEAIHGYLIDLNDQLSHMAGTQVDVRSIDWSKGPQQFDAAQPPVAAGSPQQ